MFYTFPSMYGLQWIFQVLRPTDACTMSLYFYLKPRDKSKFSAVFSTFHILYTVLLFTWNIPLKLYLEGKACFGTMVSRYVTLVLSEMHQDTIVFTQQIQCSHMYVSPKRPCILFLFCCDHDLTRYQDLPFFFLYSIVNISKIFILRSRLNFLDITNVVN